MDYVFVRLLRFRVVSAVHVFRPAATPRAESSRFRCTVCKVVRRRVAPVAAGGGFPASRGFWLYREPGKVVWQTRAGGECRGRGRATPFGDEAESS